eukprot:351248-Chlamydomonas_euryale.AAC.1
MSKVSLSRRPACGGGRGATGADGLVPRLAAAPHPPRPPPSPLPAAHVPHAGRFTPVVAAAARAMALAAMATAALVPSLTPPHACRKDPPGLGPWGGAAAAAAAAGAVVAPHCVRAKPLLASATGFRLHSRWAALTSPAAAGLGLRCCSGWPLTSPAAAASFRSMLIPWPRPPTCAASKALRCAHRAHSERQALHTPGWPVASCCCCCCVGGGCCCISFHPVPTPGSIRPSKHSSIAAAATASALSSAHPGGGLGLPPFASAAAAGWPPFASAAAAGWPLFASAAVTASGSPPFAAVSAQAATLLAEHVAAPPCPGSCPSPGTALPSPASGACLACSAQQDVAVARSPATFGAAFAPSCFATSTVAAAALAARRRVARARLSRLRRPGGRARGDGGRNGVGEPRDGVCRSISRENAFRGHVLGWKGRLRLPRAAPPLHGGHVHRRARALRPATATALVLLMLRRQRCCGGGAGGGGGAGRGRDNVRAPPLSDYFGWLGTA